MTVKIEQNLPQLLDEHRAILEASKRLGDAARRELKPQFHSTSPTGCGCTRIAEEVLYPAAILLGEHLGVVQEAKRSPSNGEDHDCHEDECATVDAGRAGLLCGPCLGADSQAAPPSESRVNREFGLQTYCASCHGESGRGNGAVAIFLRRRPADLTQIAMRNKGTFPADRVYQMIDGRQAVKAHGESQMPV